MNVGDIIHRSGFFTRARYLRAQSAQEIESRLGYHRGRFADGWYLCFMIAVPDPVQFEFRGYTHMSGGVPLGHKDTPPDPRTAEQRLADDGVDMQKAKMNLVRNGFSIIGPDRLAKAIPVRGEIGGGEPEYPPGSGFPQWELKRASPLPFKVATFMAPGQTYQGTYD